MGAGGAGPAESSRPPPTGPLPLPGPRGGPPALRGQPQHLRRPQVGPLPFHRSELRPRRAGPGDPVVHLGVWAPPGSDRCPDCKGPITQTPSRLRVGTPRPRGAGALTRSCLRPALRGFFQAGSAVHLIEPLDGSGEAGQHALYQAQHLRQKTGTCGVSNTSLESILGPRTSAAFRPRVRRPLPASPLSTWACASLEPRRQPPATGRVLPEVPSPSGRQLLRLCLPDRPPQH